MGKYLEENEAKKLQQLAKKLKRGKELNAKQQEKYNYLTEKKAAGKQFGYSKDAKGLAAEAQAGQFEAGQQIKYGNANQYNPFGQQEYSYNPETGAYELRQGLSGNQQAILEGGEGLTKLGQSLATQQLQGYKGFNQTGSPDERARIEDEVFNRLTRTTERDYQREKDQLEQTLHNRGIPLNPSDPNYQAHMQALNERYDTFKQDARARATEMGGQEAQRAYNMGLSTHQQGLQDVQNLQGFGSGQMLPQFQGFQGGQFGMESPIGLATGKEGIAASQANTKNQAGMLGVAQGQVALQGQQLAFAQQQANKPKEESIYE